MVDVTIYTRMMCGYCTAAKRLLDRKGVAYTEHDASFSPELRQEMIARANGRSTFPQIFVGDMHVGGSDDLHELERHGKLDGLLAGGTDELRSLMMGMFKAAAIQMRSGTDAGAQRRPISKRWCARRPAQGADLCADAGNDRRAGARQAGAGSGLHQPRTSDLIVAAARRLSAELGIHPACRLDRDRARRRQDRQPRVSVRSRRRARSRRYDKIHMFDVDLDNGESWRESGDL